jgi:hypothetical protein
MAGDEGARPGAGAKPEAIIQAKKNFAASTLPDERKREMWKELLTAIRVTAVAVIGGDF